MLLRMPSRAIGVSHFWPGSHEVLATSIRLCGPFVLACVFGARHTVGVGIMCEDPKSLADMWGAHIIRSQHTPRSIIPCCGQRPEYGSESPSKQHWAVFHKDPLGLHFANDSVHLVPQAAARAFKPSAFSSHGNILTREAAGDDIDLAAPWGAIEGADVIPQREAGQLAVTLAGEQHFPCVGLDFNRADGIPAK